jgi:type III pantothenate kinase
MKRLAIDVGNTKTAIGLFEDGDLEGQWRIGTRHWTADEFWLLLEALIRQGNGGMLTALAYACVVPQVKHTMENVCRRYLSVHPVEVKVETSGLETAYLYPHELGGDRIANAVGAMMLGPAPAIIADFGTATTFDVVDAAGSYQGGAILPGIGTSAGELFNRAEQLNPVDLVFPGSVLGQTTEDAIRSGVLFGAVGAADHLVDLLSRGLDREPALWATGGWAAGVAPRCRSKFSIVPELTLIGIDEIGRRNG